MSHATPKGLEFIIDSAELFTLGYVGSKLVYHIALFTISRKFFEQLFCDPLFRKPFLDPITWSY